MSFPQWLKILLYITQKKSRGVHGQSAFPSVEINNNNNNSDNNNNNNNKAQKSCSHYYVDIWKYAKTLSEMQILVIFIRGKCHKPYDSRIAHQIKHKSGGRVCERAVNKHAYAKTLTHHESSWVEWRALRMIWFKILSSWLYKKHAMQYFSIVKRKLWVIQLKSVC